MAQFVGTFNTSHSPFCYTPPEEWNNIRARRSLREDVPQDDISVNIQKSKRIKDAFSILREKLAASAPEVIIVFGNDQFELFDFNNLPAFSIYLGEEFAGSNSELDGKGRGPGGERLQAPKVSVKGHPQMAGELLTGLMRRGFDPALSLDLPKPAAMCHAIMRPLESLTDYSIPIVPVMLNCYFAPQVTAMRCYEFGRAVREVLEEDSSDLRVAVIGSGGLWHTPNAKNAYLDEEFDGRMLRSLEAGDVHRMAEYFDSYQIPSGDHSQEIPDGAHGGTGLPFVGGPQGGTREACNWITASAVADGSRFTVVDYVPAYASPLGAGFAYCTDA